MWINHRVDDSMIGSQNKGSDVTIADGESNESNTNFDEGFFDE